MEIIKSKDNPLIKKVMLLMESKKERTKSGQFVIEGLRICKDAALNSIKIHTVLMTEDFLEKHKSDASLLENSSNQTKIISLEICKKLSGTVNSQGVFCVCDIPKSNTGGLRGKFIGLENLQDPGNIGTIIRTAEAFGINGICLIGNCVDVFSPKVLRSTMGAIFRIPMYFYTDAEEAKCEFEQNNIKCFGAVLNNEAEKLSETDFENNCICLIGNEANGLTDAAKGICDDYIYIEMSGKAESLNAAVAASVIMWEMSK